MFERLGNASWTEVHPALFVEGDVAWLTSHVLVESPEVERKFVGRGTEIWIRRDGQWRLVHGHWSEHPAIYAD
jgi:ketosteroid isomerase-like protein